MYLKIVLYILVQNHGLYRVCEKMVFVVLSSEWILEIQGRVTKYRPCQHTYPHFLWIKFIRTIEF